MLFFTRVFCRIERSVLLAFVLMIAQLAIPLQAADNHIRFRPIPTQYIAALGDPQAFSGGGAQHWGLWRRDPGPRGVWLRAFEELKASQGLAPANWLFDSEDWWLDENGLLMEKPDFPVPPGRYLVTGDRETVTVLTVHPEDQAGDRRWELHNGAVLYDVTHLPCRSARYRPEAGNQSCSPDQVGDTRFPVLPGIAMPSVQGCHRQDYAVLFVIGVEIDYQRSANAN